MIYHATSPFSKEDEIFGKLTDQTIPSPNDLCLADEFSCALLETLYPHLYLISRKSSSHIDPLHVHIRKRRTITISEQVRLHLVWGSGVVYIKPIPSYLLSSVFWERYLHPGNPSRAHALGFMRTYAYLIRHRSDFHIAQKEDLIPPSEKLQYGAFEKFIRNFRSVQDDQVSPRWEFGQFRLMWLDWAVRILQPKAVEQRQDMFHRLFYEQQYHEAGQFVREFGAVLLFLFAALSLILSSMQVVLAAREGDPWPVFAQVSSGFSVAVIIALVVAFIVIFAVVEVVLTLQLGFALRAQRRRKNEAGG